MELSITQHGKESETNRLDPWVCFECGNQGNVGERCSACRAQPDSSVTQDGLIEFVLMENPSTGFEWSCTVTPEDALEMVVSSFRSDEEADGEEPLSGVGGTHIFRFRPIKDGLAAVRLSLKRGDELDAEGIFTYQVSQGVPVRVLGEKNVWVCECGDICHRPEQTCYKCGKAMPGLEDSWYCWECGRYRAESEASCPDCGAERSYEEAWICTCGYEVKEEVCERCYTVSPAYENGWVCPECDTINAGTQLCEFCSAPNDNSAETWICKCRHINNWPDIEEEQSKVCSKCGAERPLGG